MSYRKSDWVFLMTRDAARTNLHRLPEAVWTCHERGSRTRTCYLSNPPIHIIHSKNRMHSLAHRCNESVWNARVRRNKEGLFIPETILTGTDDSSGSHSPRHTAMCDNGILCRTNVHSHTSYPVSGP
jgi:hypothetical protein